MLPSSERQRIREKYKLSAAAYEKLREKVKGPEELKQEMEYNEVMAKLKFDLETMPDMKDALQKQVEKDLAEGGIEAVLEHPDIPADLKQQLEAGTFDVTIDSPSEDEPDQLVIVPEGNVSEKMSVSSSLSDRYLSQMMGDK